LKEFCALPGISLWRRKERKKKEKKDEIGLGGYALVKVGEKKDPLPEKSVCKKGGQSGVRGSEGEGESKRGGGGGSGEVDDPTCP